MPDLRHICTKKEVAKFYHFSFRGPSPLSHNNFPRVVLEEKIHLFQGMFFRRFDRLCCKQCTAQTQVRFHQVYIFPYLPPTHRMCSFKHIIQTLF